MMFHFWIVFNIFLGMCTKSSIASLNDYLRTQLTSYEVLDPVRIVSKRSLTDDSTRHLHFEAFNRKFHLVLRRAYTGTAPTWLTVQAIQNNVLKPYDASALFSDFFSGYIEGDPNSRVSGYRADDNRFHLTIDDGVDVFTIEPLSLLLGNQSDTRMLAYYDSNINGSEHFCAQPDANQTLRHHPFPSGRQAGGLQQQQQRIRQRRSPAASAAQPLTRVCRLQLVADYTFVQKIASGSVGSTVKCLIKIADDINSVYQETRFVHPETKEEFVGIGFELANLVVLDKPQSQSQMDQYLQSHFNARSDEGKPLTASQYLEAFGDYEQNGLDLSSYCLNHLVTFRPMQQNILGLAYLGSRYTSNIGGICSQPSVSAYGRQKLIGRNIGMTTYANKDGNPILSRQALLVSAHELGHNMGSEHDTGECTPTWSQGGPYLMYQIAVTGNAEHNSKFSECSSKQIAVVIKERQVGCFHNPRNTFCGNRRREEGEDCDAGSGGDACCTEKCRLRPGAVCSDANSPCCTGCRLATSSTICQRQSPLHPCQANTTCNGTSQDCPPPASLRNGTACQFGVGVCVSGKCDSVCSQMGQRPCSCQQEAESCLVCCQPRNNLTVCTPYRRPDTRMTVSLPANQPCNFGRCLANGTCQRLELGSGQLIVRLWNLIVQSGSNSVATFLWKNIVFTVIILSLLLWVPACLIIAYQDRLDAKKVESGFDTVGA